MRAVLATIQKGGNGRHAARLAEPVEETGPLGGVGAE